MVVFTITLIRHGETDYNRKRIIQGQMDTELADKGVYQAELCGQRLQHERFTHAYTSDLKRALMTSENILKYNTVTKCPLIKDVRLRERNFGEYEGRPCEDFMALLKKAKCTVKHMQDFTPPKGESLREVRKRATEWFYEVCHQVRQMYENENVGNHDRTSESSSHPGFQSPSNNSQSLTPSQTSPSDDPNNAANSDTNNTDSEGHGSVSISSLSSGQNSSFDETDHGSSQQPPYIPDILVVSHGGFLKELVAYFCEELDAVLPGGLKSMSKTPFNTAVSKFSVNMREDGTIHTTCLMLNDRDHLLQAEVTVVKVDEI